MTSKVKKRKIKKKVHISKKKTSVLKSKIKTKKKKKSSPLHKTKKKKISPKTKLKKKKAKRKVLEHPKKPTSTTRRKIKKAVEKVVSARKKRVSKKKRKHQKRKIPIEEIYKIINTVQIEKKKKSFAIEIGEAVTVENIIKDLNIHYTKQEMKTQILFFLEPNNEEIPYNVKIEYLKDELPDEEEIIFDI